MKFFAAVALFAVLASAHAGLVAAPAAKILQGPSTKTTVVGPDGSVISAVAPGGRIVTEEHPGVVAHAAPALYAEPVVAAVGAYHAAPLAAVSAYAVPAGSGLEGQYVHDYTETLYDDGSYRPEHY